MKVKCLACEQQARYRARKPEHVPPYRPLNIGSLSSISPLPLQTLFNPLPPMSKQDRISSLNINTVPRRKVMRIGTVCHTVGRITNEILGVKRANR